MKKKMINGFPVPFTHTTPIKNQQPPSKIVRCKNFDYESRGGDSYAAFAPNDTP